jgi:hypothetical protein
MKYVNWLIILVGWSVTGIDLWCWYSASSLPFAAYTKDRAEALGHYQTMTVYASLALLAVALLLTRRASARTRWLAISGPVVNFAVFGASILHLLLALSGAHIT